VEFHQLREALKSANQSPNSGLPENDVAAFVSKYWDIGHRFSFNPPKDWEWEVDPSLLRLPFPHTFVRMRAVDEGGSLVDVFFWCFGSGDADALLKAFVFVCSGRICTDIFSIGLRADNFEARILPGYEELYNEEVAPHAASMLATFICLLNKPNQKTDVYEPSASLNRRRFAAGKCPLYSYKTLTVLKTEESEHGGGRGGSHMSPREHWRRGHWRQLTNRLVWVKSALVGDRSRGIVFKDYEVRP
jgi:hypothetical protein